MSRIFSIEEAALVSIYKGIPASLEKTISKINEAMPYMEDEMKSIALSTISKLEEIGQKAFEETHFDSLG